MKLTIKGIPPYDGEYPVDLARLSNRDRHDIKRLSGHMPLQVENAVNQGDTDIFVALAVIALRKSGRFQRIAEDAIWDAEDPLAITLDFTDEEEQADAVPPPSETSTPSTPSGSPSSTVSELRPESPLPSTGTLSSDTSASDQAISGS